MQNVSTAVMERRVEADDSLDDFPTPPWATRALIEHVIMPRCANTPEIARMQLRRMTVREPCANRGYMARPLAEYFGRVKCSDIFDYGVGYPVEDYLLAGGMTPAEWTIFNFPFRLGVDFILRSFETPAWMGTAAIVRTAFKEGEDRYTRIFRDNPPTIIAQFVERVVMTKGIVRNPNIKYWNPTAKDPKTGEKTGAWVYPSTATSYCWMVWMNGVPPRPPVWIPPCRKALERHGDYPEAS